MTTLVILEFEALSGVQLIMYDVKRGGTKLLCRIVTANPYRRRHVISVIEPLVNVLSYLGLYGIAERICMDPVLFTLAFHFVMEIDWSLFG